MLKQPTIKNILIISLTLFFSQSSAYAINNWGGWWGSVNMRGPSTELTGNHEKENKFAYYVTFVDILSAEAYGRCYNPGGGAATANGLPFKAIQQSTVETNTSKPKGKGHKKIILSGNFSDIDVKDSVVCEDNNGQGQSWPVMWAVLYTHVDDVKVGKCYKEANNCKDSDGKFIEANFEIIEHAIFDCAFDEDFISPYIDKGEKPPPYTEYFCNKK